MASFQQVIMMGNLTRDPDRRMTNSGTTVAEFSIAVNSTRENESPYYGDIVAFGKTAENVCRYLHKGSSAMVIGKLKSEDWTDKNGNKRQKTRIYADTVQFIGGAQNSQKNDNSTNHSGSIEDGTFPAGPMFDIINNPNPFAQEAAKEAMATATVPIENNQNNLFEDPPF